MRYNLKDLKDAQEEMQCAKDNLAEILEDFIEYFEDLKEMCDDLDLEIVDISSLSGN